MAQVDDTQAITDVSRSLQAYYTFDAMTADDSQGNYPGYQNGGSFVEDTPSGTGRSLLLKKGEFISIPYAPLNNRKNCTVSLWVKDFNNGCLLKSFNRDRVFGASLFVVEGTKLRCFTGNSAYNSSRHDFNTDLAPFQDGQWVMLSVVTRTENGQTTNTLYVNGRRADQGNSDADSNDGAMAMTIGGQLNTDERSAWADPMKIDNIRLYSAALTDEEIQTVYQLEKRGPGIALSPLKMEINQDMSQLFFTITNNSARDISCQLTDNTGILTFTPTRCEVPAHSMNSVEVSVTNRETQPFRRGTVTVTAEGSRHTVAVEVQNGVKAKQNLAAVTRGLAAYYNFDDSNADDQRGSYHGMMNGGTFIDDTPTGLGKALSLRQKEFVSIAQAPLDGKQNFTVSFWIKDFSTGCIVKAMNNDRIFGPSVILTEAQRLLLFTGNSAYNSSRALFNTNLSALQSDQWNMITIVTHTEGHDAGLSTLYVNGQRTAIIASDTDSNKGASSMTIGGQNSPRKDGEWADAMKIDNLRLYSVALTDEEVQAIYATEK